MMNIKIILYLILITFWTPFSLSAQTTSLFNINIVDVENGKIIPAQTIKIKRGKISKISKAKKRIRSHQIDFSGFYILPGLIDSHTHWGNFCNTSQNMTDMAKTYLSEGVTTVRDAGGDQRIVKQYQFKQDQGQIVGPSVYMSSFWAGPNYYKMTDRRDTRGYSTPDAPWSQQISDSLTNTQLEKRIIEAKRFGCTGIKLYYDISSSLLQRIVPLCKKHGIKPWGHFSTFPATAMEVVLAGVNTVSHAYLIDNIDGSLDSITKQQDPQKKAERNALFHEMIKQGTILDPTIDICVENAIPTNILYTREAYHAGVKIAAGTDYIEMENKKYKSVFLKELSLLVDSCGMTIPDVLRAATLVGAEVIGQNGKLGVIRKGAEADLIILKGNPLKSLNALKNIEILYLDGQPYIN